MAHHARVEELSDTDSDPEIMDPSSFAAPSTSGAAGLNSSLIAPNAIPIRGPSGSGGIGGGGGGGFGGNFGGSIELPAAAKSWTCLYPVYFDSSRSRAEGRRVGKQQAVESPLARTMVDAVAALGLKTVFEPGKTHPKDWANPGRVRVLLKDESGKRVTSNIRNKHHLYILVSEYLQKHPTQAEDPLKLQIRGLPTPEKPPGPPAVPRGWKINPILPLHSPAMTGGGVSENFLRDVMAEMSGQPPPSTSEVVKKKKDKKDKGKKK